LEVVDYDTLEGIPGLAEKKIETIVECVESVEKIAQT